MVYFVYPYLFWVLIIPFFVLAVLLITNKSRLDRLFDPQILDRLRANKDSLPQVVRNILFFTALFMMIIAMARPIADKGEKKISLQGSNIVLALDISKPNERADNDHNTLDDAKQKTKILLQNMSNDEVALTAFANNAFLVSPFTHDKFSLEEILDGIDNKYIKNNIRNFKALGELIVFLTKNKPNKMAIIISNDINEDIPEDFKSLISKNDIKLFIVPLSRDIKELLEFLSSHNADHRDKFVLYRDQKELFYYPLGLSLILLIVAWSSLPKRIKK
ncbi:MAG: VWA domain-containing protein [Sulfurovaceae bacterium]|jgi:Ca-activated chloride channel family protein|nr:VWA domain-containing protein [Sulfurovaceae bacterium]